ncbi:hypothetical protein CF327_g5825 [Tilletia walkeri]|nr:hypothetical protein CF327_g5825 [Tilletia walkeri]
MAGLLHDLRTAKTVLQQFSLFVHFPPVALICASCQTAIDPYDSAIKRHIEQAEPQPGVHDQVNAAVEQVLASFRQYKNFDNGTYFRFSAVAELPAPFPGTRIYQLREEPGFACSECQQTCWLDEDVDIHRLRDHDGGGSTLLTSVQGWTPASTAVWRCQEVVAVEPFKITLTGQQGEAIRRLVRGEVLEDDISVQQLQEARRLLDAILFDCIRTTNGEITRLSTEAQAKLSGQPFPLERDTERHSIQAATALAEGVFGVLGIHRIDRHCRLVPVTARSASIRRMGPLGHSASHSANLSAALEELNDFIFQQEEVDVSSAQARRLLTHVLKSLAKDESSSPLPLLVASALAENTRVVSQAVFYSHLLWAFQISLFNWTCLEHAEGSWETRLGAYQQALQIDRPSGLMVQLSRHQARLINRSSDERKRRRVG